MTGNAIILIPILLLAAGMLGYGYWHGLSAARARSDRERSLWQFIHDLQADNRALTESLCRAEGKPFITPRQPLQPSEGWYDAKPRIIVRDENVS